MNSGRVPDGTGLSQAEPQEGLGPSGFDPSRVLGLSSVLRFGKYRGLAIGAIVKFDPGYLAWMRKNLDRISFDEAALAALRPALAEDREQSMQRQEAWCWGFGAGARRAADSRRQRMIRIEHEERAKAGQTTCHCFPHNWAGCADCHGAGWVSRDSDRNPEGRDAAERLGAQHESAGPKDIAGPQSNNDEQIGDR